MPTYLLQKSGCLPSSAKFAVLLIYISTKSGIFPLASEEVAI